MRSLLDDLDCPGVSAFLDAVDTVMNSNTFLLKVRVDRPITVGGLRDTLGRFLGGPLFGDMMLAADRTRDWWMLHHAPFEVNEKEDTGWRVQNGLVLDDARLDLGRIDIVAFTARLRWMLREAPSPYRRHLGEEHAQDLIGALFRDLFGPLSWPLATPMAQRCWAEARWSFYTLRPDFLRSTEYYTGKPCPDLAYFDGGAADTAMFFYQDDVFYLLLTNGSP